MGKRIVWEDVLQKMMNWRETIHRNPELSHKEFKTTEYIVKQLSAYPQLEITRPALTGIIVRLKGAFPGRTIAFRADIDALPVTEKIETAFRSSRSGVMHACGHDMHTAILMGVASVLAGQQRDIHGEIVFIFQRGEEMSPGGAKELVESGVLGDVEMFFALHVLPSLPCGTVALKRGIATANRDTFNIWLQGKGGHSSMPYLTVDTCIATAETVMALQTIVSREIAPYFPAVLSVCSLICGDGTTATIPGEAHICGTNRTFTPVIREQIKSAMVRIVHGIAQAHRCRAEVKFDAWDYSSIINDEALCDIVRYMMQSRNYLFREESTPMYVGEDFSEYQVIAPVCFAWLGTGNGEGEQAPLHNAYFNPDSRALLHGMKYYLGLVGELVM
ncbi:amidohydrolase [Escherichia coli]|nr:amidohydrolase [Escherichia coli]MBB8156304.1 amidohydrolase [Escherichia coli]HBB0172127.1 amidohydrolase [Escherichia coli]